MRKTPASMLEHAEYPSPARRLCRLAHAKLLKAIAHAKVKTDAVDAATVAQLLRADLIPGAHMISPELRELRDLLRARLATSS